jgi:hypothetical protein
LGILEHKKAEKCDCGFKLSSHLTAKFPTYLFTMIKMTPRKNRVPLFVAVATAALISAGASHAAVDQSIITEAQQSSSAAFIEDVDTVAIDFAARMGSGSIKLSPGNARALAAVLSDSLQAKTPGSPDDPVNNPTRFQNQADEIAESAAHIAAGINVNSSFKKKANSIILSLLQGALTTAKKNAAYTTLASPNLIEDVVGSVMLTLVRDADTTAKQDSKIFKFLKTNATKVAGKKSKKSVKTGLKLGFANDGVANGRYEDGTNGRAVDPETDTRRG